MINSIQRQHTSHNLVVAASADTYVNQGVKTYINSPDEKNKEVGGFYPDLVAESENKHLTIEEIETKDTITELECVTKWAPYSGLGNRFILIIPKGFSATARRLLREHNVFAYIQQYSIDSGQVTFYDYLGNKVP